MTNPVRVNTNCLFCENSPDKVLFPEKLHDSSFTGFSFSARRERQREHYRIVRCEKCGLIRSDPIIDLNTIDNLYTESSCLSQHEIPYAAKTYAKLTSKLLKKYSPNRIQSLLEVGCGTGFFLKEALGMGLKEVLGFEPSRDCCEKADATVDGLIINSVFDSDMIDGKTFDLICSFHVFDHLPNPRKTIASLSQHLSANGMLLLVVHDVESLSAKILGDYSPIFDVEHIYLFSKNTIKILLENADFKTLETGSLTNTYPLEYWMRMAPFISTLRKFFPQNLAQLPVSLNAGNLYILAQKK